MGKRNIHGYEYNEYTYCSACLIDAMPTGEGQAFDGWGLAPGIWMMPEQFLNELAFAFGIDRSDEDSFSSMEFPKPIYEDPDDKEEGKWHCDVCWHNFPPEGYYTERGDYDRYV